MRNDSQYITSDAALSDSLPKDNLLKIYGEFLDNLHQTQLEINNKDHISKEFLHYIYQTYPEIYQKLLHAGLSPKFES
ncbi:hypothetical protein [Curvivirga sp.]|uniref:hypothetical protein n=1 Tax=Curvivirga sp. TaxID=2856848 RepID=UPI003B5CDDFD